MKKQFPIFAFILFINSFLLAQDATQKGLAIYNQIFYMDTVYLNGNETESFLYFDISKQQSVYVWNRKSKAKSKEFVKANDGMAFIKIKNGGF